MNRKLSNRFILPFSLTISVFAGILGCTGNGNGNGLSDFSDKDIISSTDIGSHTDTDAILSFVPSSVEVIEPIRLRIFYPNYSRIDLVCENMPEKSDSSVIFMASAAYTVKCKDTFSHDNIIGNHVSGGQLFRGAPSKTYRGAFVYYNDSSQFIYNDWAKELKIAAENGGCGFAQDMMIHKGREVDHWRKSSDVNSYRALCLIDGKVSIADSDGKMKFGDFITNLLQAGATEAIYLDMGGWNYSWYRDDSGKAIDIHPIPNKYATNWITFYK